MKHELPAIETVRHKGEVIDEYSVDEGLDNSNAGDGTLYDFKGKLYEVVVWNNRALDHKEGDVTMAEVTRDVDDDE
jgi:hypothetical protein